MRSRAWRDGVETKSGIGRGPLFQRTPNAGSTPNHMAPSWGFGCNGRKIPGRVTEDFDGNGPGPSADRRGPRWFCARRGIPKGRAGDGLFNWRLLIGSGNKPFLTRRALPWAAAPAGRPGWPRGAGGLALLWVLPTTRSCGPRLRPGPDLSPTVTKPNPSGNVPLSLLPLATTHPVKPRGWAGGGAFDRRQSHVAKDNGAQPGKHARTRTGHRTPPGTTRAPFPGFPSG
jgi:hypothetical protein